MRHATFELRTHDSIRAFGETTWNDLVGSDFPFLNFSWLDALERTGCVVPERGWMPFHLGLYRNGELVAAAPAYVKGNSEGEFVFDHAWARFAYDRLRIDYYPKLLVAVPFTPATGPRIIVRAGNERSEIIDAFTTAFRRLAESAGLSGVHVLFPPADQARELARVGLAERHGLQFHWNNPGYASFDEFLERFDSKRRNQIRRERRELARQGIAVEVLNGERLAPELVDAVYDFYTSTVQKFFWGRQYLNRAFFEEVCARLPGAVHVVLARDAGSRRPIGGAFNLLGRRALYGRYWGAREERPFMHFNVCFYESIQWCIDRGIELFEPGAGGEHKVSRGFEPSLTYSAHLFADPRLDAAVRDYLEREQAAIEEHLAVARRDAVLKPHRSGA